MHFKKSLLYVGLYTGMFICLSCSKPAPHLGETVVHTDAGDDVTITSSDTRRLLPNGKIAGSESASIHSESVVEKIDYKTKVVTIKSADSDPIELIAGSQVINFDKIKVGDKVIVDYLVSVAFEVRKPTADELAVAGDSLRVSAQAAAGQMPAGASALTSVKISTVQSINKEEQTITLKGSTDNKSATFKAKYPENLSYVKAGDTIVITTLEAYATEVTKIE